MPKAWYRNERGVKVYVEPEPGERVCSECGLVEDNIYARYCIECGAILPGISRAA